jgi:hypothetical protein
MSDVKDTLEHAEPEAPEDEAMRSLLKRALAPEAAPESSPSLLAGVQKRIRRRSKGKFYADGWSTTQSKVNYVLIAAVMLLLVVVAYFALGPVGITPR